MYKKGMDIAHKREDKTDTSKIKAYVTSDNRAPRVRLISTGRMWELSLERYYLS